MEKQGRKSPGLHGRTFRISDLVAASGVSRDMIKYYLRAKLLPSAHKPRANLSLYSENHLELIRLIHRFQEQTKLSLEDIAEVFKAAEYDANAIEIELLSARHRVSSDHNIIPLPSSPEPTRGLSFPAEFLQELATASLLADPQNLKEGDEEIAGLLWAARGEGVPLTFFEEARGKLAELADLEVKTLIAIKRPHLSFSATVESVSHVDRIINRWLVAEKNYQARSQFQRVLDNSERAISSLLETIYLPSPLFRQRYNVEAMLQELTTKLESDSTIINQSHDLCVACLLLAAHQQAIALAEQRLVLEPGDAISTAIIAFAHSMQNNVDEAFEYCSPLESNEVSHPAIMQARMLSMLLKAAKQRGVTDTAELMKKAGELFLEIPGEPSTDEPETVLILARANVAFPDFANSRPQAIKSLQALQEKIESNTIALPELPISGLRECLRVIYHIYVLYYLGVLHTDNGDDAEARRCFEQVIQLDPASNFGERAYLKLGDPKP